MGKKSTRFLSSLLEVKAAKKAQQFFFYFKFNYQRERENANRKQATIKFESIKFRRKKKECLNSFLASRKNLIRDRDIQIKSISEMMTHSLHRTLVYFGFFSCLSRAERELFLPFRMMCDCGVSRLFFQVFFSALELK